MFTDMHNHFVYGVDDGCADQDAMLKLLFALEANRITHLVSTPHITPGLESFPMEAYHRHFGEARELIRREGLHMEIYTGHEILYTDLTARYLREGQALTLAGSEYALIEFMPGENYARLCEAAQKVRNAGYYPVFAHIERYACLSDIHCVEELKQRYGVKMQANCSLFVHKQGFFRKRWIRNVMKNGLIDFVSTDTHDMPDREPRMGQCYDILMKGYGEETARALTGGNADILFR